MPTGIEEAGLALAIFPLLVSLIEQYDRGLEIIKRLFRWKKSLRSLSRTLAAEQQVFENTCYRLLDVVFQDGGRKARMLFRDFLSPQWGNADLVTQISKALGADQWRTLEGIVLEVKEILVGLLEHVQAGIQLNSGSPLYVRLARVSPRLRLTSTKRRLDLEDLHRNIDIFQNLVRDAAVKKHDAELECDPEAYRSLRDKVHALCEALDEGFAGHGTEQHIAMLCLSDHLPNLNTTEPKAMDISKRDAALEISFLLHVNEWRKAAFKHREGGKCPHPHCSKIQNLCGCLHGSQAPARQGTQACLGFVASKTSKAKACYCIDTISVDPRDQMLTLHEVLMAQKPHSRFPFYERDRLKLAITFATSILVFHSTPWLKDMWSPRDIVFWPIAGDLDDVAVLQPCVKKEFPVPAGLTPEIAPPMVRNVALYALAKVLIQLIENRPLIANPPGAPSQTDPEMLKATELEPTIIRKAGKIWSEVIRRCLYCEFDTDSRSATFENDDFVCKFYARVITPLVQLLEALGPPI